MQDRSRMQTMDPSQQREHRKDTEWFEWWLRLTAPPGTSDYDAASTHWEREHLRRCGLTSMIAPFVFFAPLLLLQQAGMDLVTAISIVALMGVALLALAFNRSGKQVLSALLLVGSMDLVIEGALLSAKGGLSTGWLLTFDLFIIPLITVGVLLSRKYLWLFLLLHVTYILGDFYLLPHASDLDTLIQVWHGPAVAFARPIIIQVGGCLLSFIEVRSTDRAIVRADRAEEVNALQQTIIEEKRQLELGIKEIVSTLAHAANGHFTMRASLSQENLLWQIAASLNTLFARLHHSRQAEATLRQTEQEITRLVQALRATKAGQRVIWPLPHGGPLDPLLQEVRSLPGMTAMDGSLEATSSTSTKRVDNSRSSPGETRKS